MNAAKAADTVVVYALDSIADMALITICGLPAVGKTSFAAKLQQYLSREESKR